MTASITSKFSWPLSLNVFNLNNLRAKYKEILLAAFHKNLSTNDLGLQRFQINTFYLARLLVKWPVYFMSFHPLLCHSPPTRGVLHPLTLYRYVRYVVRDRSKPSFALMRFRTERRVETRIFTLPLIITLDWKTLRGWNFWGMCVTVMK